MAKKKHKSYRSRFIRSKHFQRKLFKNMCCSLIGVDDTSKDKYRWKRVDKLEQA